MLKLLMVVAVVLVSPAASAYSARLLVTGDLPLPSESRAPSLTPSRNFAEARQPASLLLMRGATFGIGVAAVPLSLWLTSELGHLSNQLLATAIPSLLVMGLLAPTITALLSWVLANAHLPEGQQVGFWLPWLGSMVVHCAVLVVGGFFGVSVGAPAGLMLLSVIDAVAMSMTITGIQQLAGRSVGAVQALETHSPNETGMTVVPLSRVAF